MPRHRPGGRRTRRPGRLFRSEAARYPSDRPMPILGLGISFRRAPVELLERLAFDDGDLTKAYRHAHDLEAVDEVVILSTCNRVEVYGNVPSYHSGFLALKRCSPRREASNTRSSPTRCTRTGSGTRRTTCSRSRRGWTRWCSARRRSTPGPRGAPPAEAEGAAGPATRSLFHAAARAGRRVRAETALGAAPDAFVALGADLATDALGDRRPGRSWSAPAGWPGSPCVTSGAGGSARSASEPLPRARARPGRTSGDGRGLDGLPGRSRTPTWSSRRPAPPGGDRCARRAGRGRRRRSAAGPPGPGRAARRRAGGRGARRGPG